MRLILYPIRSSLLTSFKAAATSIRLFSLLIIIVTNHLTADAQFQLGENPGYYGAQFTDQQIYDLMYAAGARSARTTVPYQMYVQYGGITDFQPALQYVYSKGMRNNTFFLFASPGPDYPGRSDSVLSNGAQSWIPQGIWLPAFNSDGSINTSNLWAKYCYDVVTAIGADYTYFEVWNEPDLSGSPDAYNDSTVSSTSWQKTEPLATELQNLNAPLEDYVQLCKITSQVIKKYQPNAQITTGGLGYPWFYQWFLRKGGGQWIDALSIHCYPYFNWVSCAWTGSACGPAGFHRNSDGASQSLLQNLNNFRAIETQAGVAHKPVIQTEGNIPRWNYVSAANMEVFPNNKAWGSDHAQRNFTIKGFTKMVQNGLQMLYLYQTGETADSGTNDGPTSSEIDAMGMYKNLIKASPGNTVITDQGIAIRTMQSLFGNYKVDGTQPTFSSGVDGVRFDSAGNKVYVIWAQTMTDTSETASGSYTLPAGSNFKKYLWNGTLSGTVSGTVSLIGDPYILVQTSGSISSVNCNAGANQNVQLPTNSASLSAAGSTATNSTISSYAWSQVSGPNTATFSGANTVSPTVGNLIAGTYSFQVKVKDANNDSCSSTVQVTVNAALTPPTVSAGSALTITLPTSSASLVGTASDLTGTITTYAWTQVSGPNTASITTPSSLTTTITGLIAGTYVFQLKVTDNNGLSATATVTITVNAATNQPPIANAGADQTITLPLDSVTLNGSASKDPDGTISKYSWTEVSGPSTATINTASGVTTIAGNLVQGTYVFKLTVTDNGGATASDNINIIVNAAANQPPVANAGTSQTITLPTSTASLNGSASYDPDGTIASYSWKELSGPSTATITGAKTATPTVSGLVAGQYTFQLTVTDNSGATATASVKITVTAPVNQPPTANAGSNQTITLPLDSVTLNGSASSDPDGTIVTYSWTKISGPATGTIVSASSAITIANNLVQGTYSFKLTVTDNGGASASDTVTVIVNAAANQPPVANAGTSQTITLPTSTTSLNGSASYDPDGTIASYSWKELSGPSTATITGAKTATPTVSGLVAGQYTFQLTVTDNSGATATASVKITVTAPVNQPPTANAGSNQTITLPLDSVTLNGSASSDPDGTIVTYSWTKISGPTTGTIVSASSAITIANNLVQGTYSFKLTVTDNGGASASDTVTVIVNAAVNKPPVANAGTSQTITLPTSTASLNGSASYDPDGTIASYSWKELSGPSTATITGATTATPSISGLVAGRYTFQLTVTDNSGATATATVRITVNAAAAVNPNADAGPDQTITLPLDSVTLDGSSSTDPDGTIVGYSWTQLSGPSGSTIVNNTSSVTIARNLVVGTYTYVLTVTDNTGLTGSDTVNITVNAAVNKPPVANAGTAQTITLPNTASLNGSASYDPDGTIASYSWTQLTGPSTTTITGSATATPTVSGLVAGRYTFQLTVTDNSGATATATVRITVVAAANQPPIANAGANQAITLPLDSATLDGSASVDPDGTISSYSWAQLSGPSSGTIVSSSTAKTIVHNLVQGTYTYVLTVTDNRGASSSDTVTVTVSGAINKPPVANAGTAQTITLPNTGTLNGTGSYDPDGTIASYSWAQLTGPSAATITGATTATPTISGLAVGRYTFQLTVTDNSGATATATVRITVAPAANQPPVANAGANQTITLPLDSATLNGSASIDPDGTIVSYTWTKISGPATGAIVSASSANTVVDKLVQGTYTYKLTVRDNSGATSSDTVTVTVNAAANKPPVANAGTSQTITLPTNTASLNGSASSDPDGTIASYSWTELSGPNTATISGNKTATPAVSGLIAGQYIFQLTVTDNSGATSTASVKITVVAAPNQPPVANAGTNQTITLPANSVALNGSKSYDPDGTIVSYAWTKISGNGAITILNSNTPTPTVQGLTSGQFVIQLVVTDNNGASGTAQVTLTVNAVPTNYPPVAIAGNDTTIVLPTNSASLNGSKSYDPDGTIASYSWSQVSGPGNAVISNYKTATPTISGLIAGQYIFKLTVTDNKGATGTDEVTVNVVTSAQSLPIANAGNDTTIVVPASSTILNGSASRAQSGSLVSYQWVEMSGPASATISTSDSSITTVSGLSLGEYTFQLTVTDSHGATAQATVNVSVMSDLRTSSTSALLLYPNPAQSTINLQLTSDSTGTMRINIFDMLGKLSMTQQTEKQQPYFNSPINISQLASGVYVMQVIIGNKKMTAKFIKL